MAKVVSVVLCVFTLYSFLVLELTQDSVGFPWVEKGSKNSMHLPGIEPGTQAWKACMLTITPQMLH